jgi:uncharacterized protein
MILAQLIVFVLIVQVIIRPVMAAWQFTRPPRLRVSFRAPEEWGVAYRDVEFKSSDGVVLSGWYLEPRNNSAIILVHGMGGNRLAVSYHAELLAHEGYGVLMFDLRAHGNSGGKIFNRNEQIIDDVLAAVAYLSRQLEATGRIGILGISAGGMMAIQAAARTVAIRAVVADGPILGSIEDLPPPANLMDRAWRYPLERYYQKAIQWFSSHSRPLPSNLAALRRVRGRPVLFISTGSGMERRLTQRLYDAAGEPRLWWEMPQAYHATGWVIEPEAYGRRITDFFNRALLTDEPGQAFSRHGQRLPKEETPDVHTTSENAMFPAGQPEALPGGPKVTGEHRVAPATAMIFSLMMIMAGMGLILMPYQFLWGAFVPRLSQGSWLGPLLGFSSFLVLGPLFRLFLHHTACRMACKRNSIPNWQLEKIVFWRPCPVPLRVENYRAILLLPVIILGWLPGFLALWSGNWLLLFWSIWLLAICSGDIAILWSLRDLPAGTMIRLLPNRPGYQILDTTR